VLQDLLESVVHVPVAQVPGDGATGVGLAVVLLGVLDHHGVLLRVEELLAVDHALAGEVFWT
jgi:hypothetical protein